MRPVQGNAKRDGCAKHMALIAAGGLAHDEHGAEAAPGVAPFLAAQDAAHRGGRVGYGFLSARWQDVKRQSMLGDLKSDDMMIVLWLGGHGLSPGSWIVCDR